MKWDVRGAWKSDGRPGQVVIEAPTQRAGELLANDQGLVVESCWPLNGAAGTRRRGGFARKAGLFLAVVGATLKVVGLAFQNTVGELLEVAGVATFGVGVLALVLGLILVLFKKNA